MFEWRGGTRRHHLILEPAGSKFNILPADIGQQFLPDHSLLRLLAGSENRPGMGS
jgi:hypothetical protein